MQEQTAHIKRMLLVVGRGRPCEHHNFNGSLGDGRTWARCEDCGETFKQASRERIAQAAKRYDEAMTAVLSFIDAQAAEIERLRAAIKSDQAACHAEEIAAYELTVSNLRAQREQGEPAVCHGVPDKDCNYMMSCYAGVCNKCGRKHHGIWHLTSTPLSEDEIQDLRDRAIGMLERSFPEPSGEIPTSMGGRSSEFDGEPL